MGELKSASNEFTESASKSEALSDNNGFDILGNEAKWERRRNRFVNKVKKLREQEAYVNPNPVVAKLVPRDFYQSTNGHKQSADDFVNEYKNVANYWDEDAVKAGQTVKSVQVAGGARQGLTNKNGMDCMEDLRQTVGHFRDAGVQEIGALWRGDCGTSYSRLHEDTLRKNIRKHLEAGVNTLQNFNGMNTIEMMESAPRLLKQEAKKLGVEAKAIGTICIQQNPDTLDRRDEVLGEMLMHATDLVKTGHQDFYLKCANGVLEDEDFVAEAVQMLKKEFPEQKIGLHMHSTYGYAPKIAEAVTAAGIDSVDVQVDAHAEGPAHMALGIFQHTLEHSSNESAKSRAPVGLNLDEISKDDALRYANRLRYAQYEMSFDLDSVVIAEQAGAAGGAIGSLKGIDGLVRNVSSAIKVDENDWESIRNAVYKQVSKNASSFGYATNVTPYQLMQDLQGAMDASSSADDFHFMANETVEYFSGQLGNVSSTADPHIQNKAIKQAIVGKQAQLDKMSNGDQGYDALQQMVSDLKQADKLYEDGKITRAIRQPMRLPRVKDLPKPIAEQELKAAGVSNPTDDQILNVEVNKAEGLKFAKGEMPAFVAPQWPEMMEEGGALRDVAPLISQIGFDAVELHKHTAIGFYEGMNGVDERIAILEERIETNLEDIADYLNDNKAYAHVWEAAQNAIHDFCEQRGADPDDVPELSAYAPEMLVNEGPNWPPALEA